MSLFEHYSFLPKTIHVKGDKTFGEIQDGDVLYMLDHDHDGYRFVELKVTNSWHQHRGIARISCLLENEERNINFGDVSYYNTEHENKNNSIIRNDDVIIGTNKQSIYDYKYKQMQKDIEAVKRSYEYKLHLAEQLESIKF